MLLPSAVWSFEDLVVSSFYCSCHLRQTLLLDDCRRVLLGGPMLEAKCELVNVINFKNRSLQMH